MEILINTKLAGVTFSQQIFVSGAYLDVIAQEEIKSVLIAELERAEQRFMSRIFDFGANKYSEFLRKK